MGTYSCQKQDDFFVCLQRNLQPSKNSSRQWLVKGTGRRPEGAGQDLQTWVQPPWGQGGFGTSCSRHRHYFSQDPCFLAFLSSSFSSYENILAAVRRREEIDGSRGNLIELSKVHYIGGVMCVKSESQFCLFPAAKNFS